jgi:hypothetical protein
MADAARYRVEVTRAGRWWLEAVIEGPARDAALTDLLARLSDQDGFSCTVVAEREVSRLVEVGEQTRVISRRFEKVARQPG